jgi:hypothetical protein
MTKKMDKEASARTKGRTRWAGPAPARRVLPGPRSGRLLIFFPLFIYFNLKTKKIDYYYYYY